MDYAKFWDKLWDKFWDNLEWVELVYVWGMNFYFLYVIFKFYAERLAEMNGSLVFRDLSVSAEISEIFFAALV